MTLYDPRYEHDGCGVACVARLGGEASHETLERGLRALENLEHRGAEGADAETGDGAGILIQMPDQLLREEIPGLPTPAPTASRSACSRRTAGCARRSRTRWSRRSRRRARR